MTKIKTWVNNQICVTCKIISDPPLWRSLGQYPSTTSASLVCCVTVKKHANHITWLSQLWVFYAWVYWYGFLITLVTYYSLKLCNKFWWMMHPSLMWIIYLPLMVNDSGSNADKHFCGFQWLSCDEIDWIVGSIPSTQQCNIPTAAISRDPISRSMSEKYNAQSTNTSKITIS